jgi:hypothetical protein
MKATLPWLAAVIAIALAGSAARAQSSYPCPSPAPAVYGPYNGPSGMYGAGVGGPDWSRYPSGPPFNGMLFGPGGPNGNGPNGNGPYGNGGPLTFPTHPYARSPRDFFMWN